MGIYLATLLAPAPASWSARPREDTGACAARVPRPRFRLGRREEPPRGRRRWTGICPDLFAPEARVTGAPPPLTASRVRRGWPGIRSERDLALRTGSTERAGALARGAAGLGESGQFPVTTDERARRRRDADIALGPALSARSRGTTVHAAVERASLCSRADRRRPDGASATLTAQKLAAVPWRTFRWRTSSPTRPGCLRADRLAGGRPERPEVRRRCSNAHARRRAFPGESFPVVEGAGHRLLLEAPQADVAAALDRLTA
jgi:hypothetical protein